MRRILIVSLALAAAAGVLAGCTEEGPTAVGGGLIGDGFRTYEVILDAPAFLEADTTYDRIGKLNSVPFALVAESFEGELSAHTLFRPRLPTNVVYQDAAGEEQRDTAFTVVGGTMTLVVDSLTHDEGPVDLEVLEVTESWDPATVSWTLRSDTAGPEPWAVPGGTSGQVLGDGIWPAGDTVHILFDSTAAAVWVDSAGRDRGGLLRTTTAGSRVRFESLTFQFRVRPESAPDTIVLAGSVSADVTVATPGAPVPDGSELRVGGVPTWRSALKFRPLGSVEVPCEAGSTTCTLPLSEVTVSQAALLLQPVSVAAHRTERRMRVEGRGILRATGVPVSRSPFSQVLATTDSISPNAFTAAPAEPNVAVLPLTGFVRQNIDREAERDVVHWLGLLLWGEQSDPVFGYAAFGSRTSAAPPRLRLMLTVPLEENQ